MADLGNSKRIRIALLLLFCGFQIACPKNVAARQGALYRAPCSGSDAGTSPTVRVWEQRSPGRLDEDLIVTDGLDYQRDIAIYICHGLPRDVYAVRAWVRPKDGQWREIRIGDLTQEEKGELLDVHRDYESASFLPALLTIKEGPPDSRGVSAQVTVPIRREGLRIGDNVRIEVRADCQIIGRVVTCPSEIINDFLTIDRYGLLTGFSDSILFIKRLGVSSQAAASGGIDSANYRPSPGFDFGLTYLHRKHAFLQFLEPGFGFNVSLVDWKDKSLSSNGELVEPVNGPVEVTIGAMGSMFDNVVSAAYGWNTNVAQHRNFVGVGFSVVGIVRKVMRSSH